jgi:hypothetical protein
MVNQSFAYVKKINKAKTTLGRSIKRAFVSGCGPNLFLPLMEAIELCKPFKFCYNDPNELSKRTRGIEINVFLIT